METKQFNSKRPETDLFFAGMLYDFLWPLWEGYNLGFKNSLEILCHFLLRTCLPVDVRIMMAFSSSLDLMVLLQCNRSLTGKELKVPRPLFGDCDLEGTGQTLALMLALREKVAVEEVFSRTVKMSFSLSI